MQNQNGQRPSLCEGGKCSKSWQRYKRGNRTRTGKDNCQYKGREKLNLQGVVSKLESIKPTGVTACRTHGLGEETDGFWLLFVLSYTPPTSKLSSTQPLQKHSYHFDHFRHQAKKSEVHASIIVLSAFSSFDVTVSATADRRPCTRKLMCHCS